MNTDTDTHLTSTYALDTTSGGALLKHYESDRSTATSTHTILGSGGTTVSVNNDKSHIQEAINNGASLIVSTEKIDIKINLPSEFYEKLKNINASKLVYSDVSTNLVQASGTTFGLVNSNIDTSSLDEFSVCPIKDGKVYYKDTNTIYSGTDGVNVDGNKITNAGVRSISTGGKDGTISVNTNGTSTDIAVKGLGSAAYTNSDAYAPKTHEHDQVYLKISAKASTAEEADTASTLGNATIGSRSMPIYLDEGTPKLCDQMPVAANNHVTQTNTTENGAYRVLLSGSANNTSETTTAKKSGNLTFNPSTGVLNATQISIGGGATLSWNGEALVISFS